MDLVHALALALGGGAVILTSACARQYQPSPDMQPEPGTGYVVTTTGAAVGRDDPSMTTAPEPSLEDVGARLAGQICEREVQCHAGQTSGAECMGRYLGRALAEVRQWPCSPAAARARAETCLAALRAEPCELDLTKRASICGPNAGCPDGDARLISPGAAHADAGAR